MVDTVEQVGNPIPLLSEDLINQLEKDYPFITPSPGTPDDKLWYEMGKRALIEELIERRNTTNFAKLESDITVQVK